MYRADVRLPGISDRFHKVDRPPFSTHDFHYEHGDVHVVAP